MVLSAAINVYIFPYNWDWYQGLLLGSILSATDPVAVVAALRSLGTEQGDGVFFRTSEMLDTQPHVAMSTTMRNLLKERSILCIYLGTWSLVTLFTL